MCCPSAAHLRVVSMSVQHQLRPNSKFFLISQQSGENFIPAIIEPSQQFCTAATLSLVELSNQQRSAPELPITLW